MQDNSQFFREALCEQFLKPEVYNRACIEVEMCAHILVKYFHFYLLDIEILRNEMERWMMTQTKHMWNRETAIAELTKTDELRELVKSIMWKKDMITSQLDVHLRYYFKGLPLHTKYQVVQDIITMCKALEGRPAYSENVMTMPTTLPKLERQNAAEYGRRKEEEMKRPYVNETSGDQMLQPPSNANTDTGNPFDANERKNYNFDDIPPIPTLDEFINAQLSKSEEDWENEMYCGEEEGDSPSTWSGYWMQKIDYVHCESCGVRNCLYCPNCNYCSRCLHAMQTKHLIENMPLDEMLM